MIVDDNKVIKTIVIEKQKVSCSFVLKWTIWRRTNAIKTILMQRRMRWFKWSQSTEIDYNFVMVCNIGRTRWQMEISKEMRQEESRCR